MEIDVKLVEQMVAQVIQELKLEQTALLPSAQPQNHGVFATLEEAVSAAEKAWKELRLLNISERQHYVETIRTTVLKRENLELLSRLTVEETGIGNYPDKLIKNRLAAEKTPGTEDLLTKAFTGDNGLTLVEYCPFGVVGAITPTTNPTETIINNAISMIAGGNTVVFSPHPRAKNVSALLVRMLNQALTEQGAPAGLLTMVAEPSIENTNKLIEHPALRILVATGGPAIVRKVLSSGKKAIGAGAGNPPVVVDETADLEKAAKDIIAGAGFDHNVPCIAEKEVFAVDSIADQLIHHMKLNGGYELKDSYAVEQLVRLVTTEQGEPNPNFVGKSAAYLLNELGIQAESEIKVIIMEVSKDHLLVQEEMMMPILPIVRTVDVDQAIRYAYEAEKGNRHTAIMHSKNIDRLNEMARLLDTTIFVKNAPSFAGMGIGGEGYTSFTIAGPTGEGMTSARSFCRKRKCVLSGSFHIR